MGRQAYLTRLAFGRSAYEPPEQIPAAEPVSLQSHQPSSSTAEARPESNQEATSANLYDPPDQQYNDRGRPINPQSRAFARELRAAQNDVLAAVGVCIRNSPPDEERRSAGQNEDVNLEEDELWSSIISLSGVIIKQTSVWWVGALRDRLMAYRISPDLTFVEIIAGELKRAGLAAFFFAGAPLYYSAIFLLDEEEWVNAILNGVRRILFATVSSRESRAAWEERLARARPALLFVAELLTSPALLHMTLQGLHLSDDNLFIPPWRAFIPFSAWSPVQVIRPAAYTIPGLVSWTAALAESPVLMIWLYRHALVDTHGWLFRTFRKRILRPVNAQPPRNELDSDAEDEDEESEELNNNSSRNFPFLDRALCFLGWSAPRAVERPAAFSYAPRVQQRHSISIPLPSEEAGDDPSNLEPQATSTTPQETASAVRQDLATDSGERLDHSLHSANAAAPPAGISPENPTDTTQVQPVTDENEQPAHPVSPISTVADDIADPTDASIRIASSEVDTGAVSLEIALPEEQRPASEQGNSPRREGARSRQGMGRISHPDKFQPKAVYNVTDLSIEPAEMLSYVLADCLANWILIPARICIIYRLAQQYVQPGGRELRAPFVAVRNGTTFTFPGLRDLPVIAGRVALCCALEGLICATFWGFECGIVVAVGRKWFGWRKRGKGREKAGNSRSRE